MTDYTPQNPLDRTGLVIRSSEDVFRALKEEQQILDENPYVLDAIAIMVKDLLQQEHDVIEEACEKALQGGLHGVMLVRNVRTWRLLSAEPDAAVPYGQIHERRIKE